MGERDQVSCFPRFQLDQQSAVASVRDGRADDDQVVLIQIVGKATYISEYDFGSRRGSHAWRAARSRLLIFRTGSHRLITTTLAMLFGMGTIREMAERPAHALSIGADRGHCERDRLFVDGRRP